MATTAKKEEATYSQMTITEWLSMPKEEKKVEAKIEVLPPKKEEKEKKKTKPAKAVLPDVLKPLNEVRCTVNEAIHKLMSFVGCDDSYAVWEMDDDYCVSSQKRGRLFDPARSKFGGRRIRYYQIIVALIYRSDDGFIWTNQMILKCHTRYNYLKNSYDKSSSTAEFGKWATAGKYMLYEHAFILNKGENDYSLLEKHNKYALDLVNSGAFTATDLLICPQLEQLYKAGYDALTDAVTRTSNDAQIVAFNRLCKPETKLQKIFQCSKSVYTTLKDNRNLLLWDTYRKMDKFGRIPSGYVQEVYEHNLSQKELGIYDEILRMTYNGKSLFTWKSLTDYIHKLDMYEGLYPSQAIIIIRDYARLCLSVDVEPNFTSDSIMREHNVMIRIANARRNEKAARDMKDACEKLAELNYEEDIFFVRGIRDYDDLCDEASQQRNCVRSYASMIASGRSLIYVMREKAHPNRSLITIELSPDKKTIRQKLLACNQPIRNKAQTEFIQRWMKFVSKKVNSKS